MRASLAVNEPLNLILPPWQKPAGVIKQRLEDTAFAMQMPKEKKRKNTPLTPLKRGGQTKKEKEKIYEEFYNKL